MPACPPQLCHLTLAYLQHGPSQHAGSSRELNAGGLCVDGDEFHCSTFLIPVNSFVRFYPVIGRVSSLIALSQPFRNRAMSLTYAALSRAFGSANRCPGSRILPRFSRGTDASFQVSLFAAGGRFLCAFLLTISGGLSRLCFYRGAVVRSYGRPGRLGRRTYPARRDRSAPAAA